MNNKFNNNCKICKKPMYRNLKNVTSRKIEGISNWLGLCGPDCLKKLDQKELSDMLLEGRLSYILDIQNELGRNPNQN